MIKLFLWCFVGAITLGFAVCDDPTNSNLGGSNSVSNRSNSNGTLNGNSANASNGSTVNGDVTNSVNGVANSTNAGRSTSPGTTSRPGGGTNTDDVNMVPINK